MKTVYSFNPKTKQYTGEAIAWKSPLEKDVYHIPSNCTELKPQALKKENSILYFIDNKWIEKENTQEKFTYVDKYGILKLKDVVQQEENDNLKKVDNIQEYTGFEVWNFKNKKWEIPLDKMKDKKIYQCKHYLNSTDWYIIRLADSGDVVPNEVKTKRTQARDNIDLIEPCKNLDELNQINTDF